MAYKQHQVMKHFFTSLKDHIGEFLGENDIATMILDEKPENIIKKDVSGKTEAKKTDMTIAAEQPDSAEAQNGNTCCLISFLGFKEVRQHNSMNKIQIKRKDDQGNEIEYLVKQPFTFELKIAALIDGEKVEDRITCLGELAGYLKENNCLDPGEFDWAGNEGASVPVEISPLDSEQMELVPEKYRHLRPYSMALSMIVGLESADPASFTRVRERKFTAIKKNELN